AAAGGSPRPCSRPGGSSAPRRRWRAHGWPRRSRLRDGSPGCGSGRQGRMPISPPMSTRPDDKLVALISQWLARHVADEELRRRIDEIGVGGLDAEQREAVDELLAALDEGSTRGALERTARETLEALALGG